jgi:hypothetical protein
MAKTTKDYAVEFARKGAKARAKALSPEERKQIARKAATARWAKKTAPESGAKKGDVHGR